MQRRTVLYVEDNPQDAELLGTALQPFAGRVGLEVVENGAQALDYLMRKGPRFAAAPRPDLVLLDLNLPVLDGLHIVSAMRALPEWQQLPIVVFSSSRDRREIDAAYARGATLYLTKPATWARYERLAEAIAGMIAPVALRGPTHLVSDSAESLRRA